VGQAAGIQQNRWTQRNTCPPHTFINDLQLEFDYKNVKNTFLKEYIQSDITVSII